MHGPPPPVPSPPLCSEAAFDSFNVHTGGDAYNHEGRSVDPVEGVDRCWSAVGVESDHGDCDCGFVWMAKADYFPWEPDQVLETCVVESVSHGEKI